jgi:phosphohistidine phosphatase
VATIGPGARVDALLQAAGWPDAAEPVLVVGHQPTLGLVAARLLADVDQPWPMKKGAVWWLRRRERDGAGARFVLQAVLGPDCL